MRRSEFKIEDKNLIESFLNKAESGTVAMVSKNGEPYATQVNLVWFDNAIWFHSGLTGTKMSILKQSPKVHISVVEESCFIPSYATSSEDPCNATQFFRSVHIKGIAEIIHDLDLKAQVLSSLMTKMQPEGKHRSLSESKKGLLGTALIKILKKEITAKFKFGQNLTSQKRASLLDTLNESTDPRAKSALEWIKKLQP